MQERLNQYRPVLAVLIAACGLLTAVLARYDITAFYICAGAWLVLSAGCIIWMAVITRNNRRRFAGFRIPSSIMSDAVLDLPMASLIVREKRRDRVEQRPRQAVGVPDRSCSDITSQSLVPGLDWQAQSSAEGRDIVIGDRHYTEFLMHSTATKEPLTIISLVDDNDLKHYTQEYF